jgi:hypothetical protein
VLGLALGNLIGEPGCVVALRRRQVHLVLHRVLEIVGIHGDRDVHIAGITHNRDNRQKDDELQTRAAAFASVVKKYLVFHSKTISILSLRLEQSEEPSL